MNILDKLEDANTDLLKRVQKMQYMRLVYERINSMFQDSDNGQELRMLSGALAQGIKIALGLLGVEEEPMRSPDEEQLAQDVDKILRDLQQQFSKDFAEL